MPTFISHHPAETEALGERWGRAAAPGLVHSPTFTLVNEYGGGRLTLFHLDLYRLETAAQLVSAGIEEFLSPDGVAVVEWAERLSALGSRGAGLDRAVAVTIEILSETERKIIYDDFGA